MSDPASDKLPDSVDRANAPLETAPAEGRPLGKSSQGVFVELVPAIVFMVAYNVANGLKARGGIFAEPIYLATAIFMAATALAFLYAAFVQKRTPLMLIVSGVIVMTFGGLGLIFHNDIFIKIKPTLINLCFAAAIFGGLLFGRNVWKILFGAAFELPDRVWHILAVRWGLFYLFLAGLNEVVWRSFSETFWVNFKLFGVMPITFIFLAANMPLMMKYLVDPDEAKRDD